MNISVKRLGLPRYQEILDHWEQNLDTDALTYRGRHIWPVVKILYHMYTKSPHPIDLSAEPAAAFMEPPDLNEHLIFTAQYGKLAQQFLEEMSKHRVFDHLSPCDVLLVSESVNAYATLEGKRFDPFLDSLYYMFNDTYRFHKVEITVPPDTPPRWLEPVYIDPTAFVGMMDKLDAYRDSLASDSSGHRVEGYSAFKDSQRDTLGEVMIGEEAVIDFVRHVEALSRLFKMIYRHTRPRLVLVVDYASRFNVAACKAASEMGIPCADVQHGAAGGGRYNFKWSWHHMPPGGYGLLPRYFWVWGDRTREMMMGDRPPPDQYHKAIVGGHPWLTLWKDEKFIKRHGKLPAELESRLSGATKSILVTLPNAIETMDFDLLAETMTRAPKDWLWLVRLHPTDINETERYEALLMDRLQTADSRNLEITIATQANLAVLLRRVNVHLTDNSSACFDALEFGVPTVFFGSLGVEVFSEYLDDEVFQTAHNADELLTAIESPRPAAHSFISTSRKQAEKALKRMLV
ncbi:MAG TPA: hypothetical protein ENI69_03010 [Rhodospirillales bacterium]|nr:hypothetical protein [Rhodospirillales bacterium]